MRRNHYEIILIDCPPSLGILTLNALTAADSILIPLQCEYYALEGITHLMGTVRLVKSSLNNNLEIGGIVLTMYDPRNSLTRDVSAQLLDHFGDVVYRTIIPRNVRLAEAPSYGVPILFSRIEDQTDNATRFLVIGRQLLASSGDDKTTLLLAGEAVSGDLHTLLTPLANHSLNMTRIESRPSSGGSWRYVFFIDVEGHADTEPLKTAIKEMQNLTSLTRVLGSYPKAVTSRDL